jgi:cellobiose-specific phosphotransferase system component IIB
MTQQYGHELCTNNEIPLITPKIKTLLRKLKTMAETKCEAIHRREYGKITHWIKRSPKGRIQISG